MTLPLRLPSPSRRALLLATAAALVAPLAAAAPASLPAPALARTIVALYDSRLEPRIVNALVHTHGAMPIEWLGMTLRYQDTASGHYPPLWADPEVRGILAWFPEPSFDDFPAFVVWVERAAAAGKRIVLLGDHAPRPGGKLGEAGADQWRARLFAAIGIRSTGGWSSTTLDDRIIHAEPGKIGYERSMDGRLPEYELFTPAMPGTASWLIVERNSVARETSHLVMVTPKGGFVAPRWEVIANPVNETLPWHIEPFAFFEAAFDAGALPRPDANTLCGRRIYYSHIDGDGWRSVSRVHTGAEFPLTTAEIVLRQVVEPNPDLPVTIAPIAAEMDLARSGNPVAIAAARALFALKQVEAATHTYTHPFTWGFFADYTPAKEAPYAERYRHADDGKHALSEAGRNAATDATPATGSCCAAGKALSLPRAFGDRPFDLNEEIRGSVQQIATLCPPGKTIGLLQWPGDCLPFAEALRETGAAGLLNINGGDTRFDLAFPTVSAVRPIGIRYPEGTHIYASNSSEELYTELWTNTFFGFRDLPITWDRTEAPRRLKPLNLYYHMYSGERLASLKAIQSNIANLRTREFIGVRASRFAQIGRGFFTTRLVPEAGGWRILDRGGLDTIRFPGAPTRRLDVASSTGVLGERITNGELYVALDSADPAPLIILRPRDATSVAGPSLVHASWEISALKTQEGGFSFAATGLGPGVLQWQVPKPGAWSVTASGWAGQAAAGSDGQLTMNIPALAVDGTTITARMSL